MELERQLSLKLFCREKGNAWTLLMPNESSLEGRVLKKGGEIRIGNLSENVIDLVQNMTDILTLRYGHAPPRLGYEARCVG